MKKEFNLEEALKGAKLVTRDGREVSEWKYFETGNKIYRIASVIDGEIQTFTKEGRYLVDGSAHYKDLFIKTEPKKCYVNVYGDGKKVWTDSSQDEYHLAIGEIVSKNYIKTIEITDEV